MQDRKTETSSKIALTKLKCIVVHLPYWEEILLGKKRIEYRSWPTSHRGLLGIAAAKRPENGEYAGCVACTVELIDCVRTGPKDFEWMLEDPRPIYPVPIKGRLGLIEIEIPLDYDVHIEVRDEKDRGDAESG